MIGCNNSRQCCLVSCRCTIDSKRAVVLQPPETLLSNLNGNISVPSEEYGIKPDTFPDCVSAIEIVEKRKINSA